MYVCVEPSGQIWVLFSETGFLTGLEFTELAGEPQGSCLLPSLRGRSYKAQHHACCGFCLLVHTQVMTSKLTHTKARHLLMESLPTAPSFFFRTHTVSSSPFLPSPFPPPLLLSSIFFSHSAVDLDSNLPVYQCSDKNGCADLDPHLHTAIPGIAVSCGCSVLVFLKVFVISHGSCPNSHSHRQWLSPSSSILFRVCLIMMAILIG